MSTVWARHDQASISGTEDTAGMTERIAYSRPTRNRYNRLQREGDAAGMLPINVMHQHAYPHAVHACHVVPTDAHTGSLMQV